MIRAILNQADSIGKIAKVLSIAADHIGSALQEVAEVFPPEQKPQTPENDEKE